MNERLVMFWDAVLRCLTFFLTAWRAVDADSYTAWMETPVLGTLVAIYRIPAALFVLIFMLFLLIGLIGNACGRFVRPQIEVNSDGDYILPVRAVEQLQSLGCLEISLSFNAPHRGLTDLPQAEQIACFAVTHDKQTHTDQDIVEWFAQRFRVDPDCISVAVAGEGVQQQFRRMVRWTPVA